MSATCTAQILIGGFPGGWGAPNRGIAPDWAMYLIEGGRAAWILEGVEHHSHETHDLVTWIPGGPEGILADALVMVAVVVDRSEDVRDLINQALPAKQATALLGGERCDLTELEDDALDPIRKAAQRAVRWKLVVTAMAGSSLIGQLGLLGRCSMDAEVCISSWARHGGDGETRIVGSLPPEDPEAHGFYEIRA